MSYSPLSHLPLIHQGKVRDSYAVDEQHLLIITTDRLSAFDVVLPQTIPGKGEVLTRITDFWLNRTRHLIPNHQTDMPLAAAIPDTAACTELRDRARIVKRLQPISIEAIVRGYLIGSGWQDYQRTGTVCGMHLPANLPQAARLPEPIYTPSSKATVGAHDENIDYAATEQLIGSSLAQQIRDTSLRLYRESAAYALTCGIIIADTKFEFGLDSTGQLHLMDEVLTPDSSRFWPVTEYQSGISPPSFDKQFVRDYLETLDWPKTPPGPQLPADIIEKTAAKYHEAEQRLIPA
ncbi:MAG: phosphoribosylaminoimidazolesuccinocarboxamide synthase [Pseudomonadota bacterium]